MPQTGYVKWANSDRRYGTIVLDEGGELFFHSSTLRTREAQALEDGDPVSCDAVDDPRGRRAENIVPLRP